MKRLALFSLVVLLSLAVVQEGTSKSSTTLYQQALRAVCFYFKQNCTTAMKIVRCETGGSYAPWSANGQYRGIFQMGSSERAAFGDGNNVWAQAKAAYAYFRVAGFGPWLNYEPPGCGG